MRAWGQRRGRAPAGAGAVPAAPAGDSDGPPAPHPALYLSLCPLRPASPVVLGTASAPRTRPGTVGHPRLDPADAPRPPSPTAVAGREAAAAPACEQTLISWRAALAPAEVASSAAGGCQVGAGPDGRCPAAEEGRGAALRPLGVAVAREAAEAAAAGAEPRGPASAARGYPRPRCRFSPKSEGAAFARRRVFP